MHFKECQNGAHIAVYRDNGTWMSQHFSLWIRAFIRIERLTSLVLIP